jgi:hypothetical protein
MDRLPDHSLFPFSAHPSGGASASPPQELIATLARALHDVAALPPTVSPVVALAQRSLADFERIQSTDRLTAISAHVACLLGVSYERLLSKSRTQHLAYCRQVAMYVCRSLAGASYTALGIMPSAGLCRTSTGTTCRRAVERRSAGSQLGAMRHNQSAFRKASRRSPGR